MYTPVRLCKVIGTLSYIYGRANALTTIGGRAERHAFLSLACADLSRCYRKKQTQLLPIAAAQAFAWFTCLCEELFRDSAGALIERGMMEKYPLNRCGYCGKSPCVCAEDMRNEHQIGTNEGQTMWSTRAWQRHLAATYKRTNEEKGGVPQALNRLFEEVAEVGLLLHMADGFNESHTSFEAKIARELTDVLAWLFGLSTLINFDLGEAVNNLYGRGCPVCKSAQCQCTSFVERPGQRGFTHRFMSAEEVSSFLCC